MCDILVWVWVCLFFGLYHQRTELPFRLGKTAREDLARESKFTVRHVKFEMPVRSIYGDFRSKIGYTNLSSEEQSTEET